MEIGSLFREFRLDKHLKLNQTAEGIVTTQFLRKFEKNESDIVTWKFFKLLQRINVTVEEFAYEYFQASNSFTIEKLDAELDKIELERSEEGWQALYDANLERIAASGSSKNSFTHLVDPIIRLMGNRLFNKTFVIDTSPTIHYLESIETWGKTEFFLASYTVGNEDIDTISKLWYLAFSKKIKSPVVQQLSADFYLHACFHLIKQKEIDLTKQLMADYETYQEPDPILQNLPYACFSQFIKGMIRVLEGDPEGETICDSMINFFKYQVDYIDYANQLEKVYHQFTA